jgi:outer membrane protein
MPEETVPLDKLVDTALGDRPEYLSLQDHVRSAQELVASARGNFGPALSLNSTLSDRGAQLDRLVPNWSVGLGLSVNLFQGLGMAAQLDEAEANLSSALAQVDLERQQIRLEIEQAQLQVNAAAESLIAAEEALNSARERLGLAEGRYQTGVGNIIELGDAQLALTNAAAQKVQADFNVSAARAQLLKTLGRA